MLLNAYLCREDFAFFFDTKQKISTRINIKFSLLIKNHPITDLKWSDTLSGMSIYFFIFHSNPPQLIIYTIVIISYKYRQWYNIIIYVEYHSLNNLMVSPPPHETLWSLPFLKWPIPQRWYTKNEVPKNFKLKRSSLIEKTDLILPVWIPHFFHCSFLFLVMTY